MVTIAKYLTAVEKKITDSISEAELKPAELYDPIRYILSNGGKRIRSVFTLLGCQAYCGDFSPAISAAAGLEVFHNFTLLHDDIMDNAPIRRGKPTVHEKWNTNTAILSGDAMMVMATDLIAETPPACLPRVLKLFNRTALQVCEGQQFDMMLEDSRLDAAAGSTEAYLEMIRLKTSVLLAAALQIGAIIGGADESEQALIYEAGISLGLGFQLQDDLLDSFGDEASFGKKIGGDIIAHKKTFLVSSAIEQATPELREKLIGLFNSADVNEQELIAETQNIFIQTGAKKATEDAIDHYFSSAFQMLRKTNATDTVAKTAIESLFTQISMRNF